MLSTYAAVSCDCYRDRVYDCECSQRMRQYPVIVIVTVCMTVNVLNAMPHSRLVFIWNLAIKMLID